MRLSELLANLRGHKRSPQDDEPARFAPVALAANRSPAHSHPYHAVSVAPGMMSCPQARKLRGIRFLSRAAPSIPLPACSMPNECACHFHKHNDRRHGDRRLFGSDPDARFYSGNERRRTSGRRSSDPRPQAS